METTTLTALTVDDLPDVDWPRHELVDGSLLVTPMAALPHQALVARLLVALTPVAAPDVVLAGVNVIADSATLAIPDLAVVTSASAGSGGLGVRPEDLLLAVEVESPSTRRRDRTLKRDLYGEWGVPYWLIDPERRTVTRLGSTTLRLDDGAIFPPPT